jgi:hypothetical protein
VDERHAHGWPFSEPEPPAAVPRAAARDGGQHAL